MKQNNLFWLYYHNNKRASLARRTNRFFSIQYGLRGGDDGSGGIAS